MNPGKKTRIVIAGGGFAGLYAAQQLNRTLAQRPDVDITLISRENFLLFTPMLHEVAAGDLSPSDIVNPLRRILRRVNVVQARTGPVQPMMLKPADAFSGYPTAVPSVYQPQPNQHK